MARGRGPGPGVGWKQGCVRPSKLRSMVDLSPRSWFYPPPGGRFSPHLWSVVCMSIPLPFRGPPILSVPQGSGLGPGLMPATCDPRQRGKQEAEDLRARWSG